MYMLAQHFVAFTKKKMKQPEREKKLVKQLKKKKAEKRNHEERFRIRDGEGFQGESQKLLQNRQFASGRGPGAQCTSFVLLVSLVFFFCIANFPHLTLPPMHAVRGQENFEAGNAIVMDSAHQCGHT
jgi:hypothetical protein